MDRMTDACENITFPLRSVIISESQSQTYSESIFIVGMQSEPWCSILRGELSLSPMDTTQSTSHDGDRPVLD